MSGVYDAEAREVEARAVFSRFDISNTGYLTREEMTKVFTELGLPISALGVQFEIADRDGDNRINFTEFIAYYNNFKLRQLEQNRGKTVPLASYASTTSGSGTGTGTTFPAIPGASAPQPQQQFQQMPMRSAPPVQPAPVQPGNALIMVACPAGVVSGQAIQLTNPYTSQTLQIVVPPGIVAGQQFHVSVPTRVIPTTVHQTPNYSSHGGVTYQQQVCMYICMYVCLYVCMYLKSIIKDRAIYLFLVLRQAFAPMINPNLL